MELTKDQQAIYAKAKEHFKEDLTKEVKYLLGDTIPSLVDDAMDVALNQAPGELPEDLEFELYEHLANAMIKEVFPEVVQDLMTKDAPSWS